MGKRARGRPGGLGRRRPRVDLTRAADEAAAVEVQDLAPDYDAWNRNAAGPNAADRDPVQAALAAKAARIQAMGPLGEHLAGYGEDDEEDVDGDGPHGTDRTRPDATEPAPPWTRLLDAKTNHPYFWNRATGATVWTLAETHTDVPRTEACTKNGEGGKQENTTPGSEHLKNVRERRTRQTATAASVRDGRPGRGESRVGGAFTRMPLFGLNGLETFSRRLQDARRRGDTFGAFGVASRNDASRARRRARPTEASELLRSRVPAVERAVERALGRRMRRRRKTARRKAETAQWRFFPTRDGVPAALTGLAAAVAAAAARRHRQPPALRRLRRRRRFDFPREKRKRTTGTDLKVKNSPLPLRVWRASCASRGHPPRWWSGARGANRVRRRPRADADPAKRPAGRPRLARQARARGAGPARTSLGTPAPVAGTGARRRRPGFARAAAGGGGCCTRKRTKRTNLESTNLSGGGRGSRRRRRRRRAASRVCGGGARFTTTKSDRCTTETRRRERRDGTRLIVA